MAEVRCSKCGESIPPGPAESPPPTICGGVMGDEIIESYHLCPRCGVYTVEVVRDRFLGEETTGFRGPYSIEKAEEWIALIRECPEPWNKRCRCKAHVAYFGGMLD